jgi:uncharacterized protein YukE
MLEYLRQRMIGAADTTPPTADDLATVEKALNEATAQRARLREERACVVDQLTNLETLHRLGQQDQWDGEAHETHQARLREIDTMLAELERVIPRLETEVEQAARVARRRAVEQGLEAHKAQHQRQSELIERLTERLECLIPDVREAARLQGALERERLRVLQAARGLDIELKFPPSNSLWLLWAIPALQKAWHEGLEGK